MAGDASALLESHCKAPSSNCVIWLCTESRNWRVNVYLHCNASPAAGWLRRLSPTPFAAVHDQSPCLLPVLTYAFPRINSAEMSMAGAQPCSPFWSHVLLADVLSPSPALTVTHHRSEAQTARPGVPRVKELSLLCLMDTHSQQCGMGQSSGAAEPLGFVAKLAGR